MGGITCLAGSGKALGGLPVDYANKISTQHSPSVSPTTDFCKVNGGNSAFDVSMNVSRDAGMEVTV
ncbi:MAG: hypothetical protein JKY11_01120 [Alphaproteobacteria bacterium]|nr:hypothetical protein [Alphaproteobacteria bacterium]